MELNEIGSIVNDLSGSSLIQILLILLTGWLLLIIDQKFFTWIASRFAGRLRLYILAIVPTLRLLIIASMTIMIITRIIDPTLQNIATLIGALFVVLGFAFRDYISSLMAGITTLFEMPYRHGDWISVEGIYGEVQSIGMRSVRVLTLEDSLVSIPHLKLWTTPLSNANNGTPDLQCQTDFFLASGHDPVNARNLFHDVALTSPYINLKKPLLVTVQELPWATRYRIKAYPLDPRRQSMFISDLVVRGKTELNRQGIAAASGWPGQSGQGNYT
jgi:small-conductance mechanosensitive channel